MNLGRLSYTRVAIKTRPFCEERIKTTFETRPRFKMNLRRAKLPYSD